MLGTLIISDTFLEVNVNSAKRAEAIKKEIEKRLGRGAMYKMTEIESVAAALAREEKTGHQRQPPSESEELLELPEVQKALKEMIARHWESWVDANLPVPENKVGYLQGRGRVMPRPKPGITS